MKPVESCLLRAMIGSRRWRFLSLVILAIGLKSDLLSAETASAVAAYSGGSCRLTTIAVQQDRWPIGHDLWTVQLRFQLEFPESQPRVPPPLLPENLYLNNRPSPLVAACVPGGKTNLAKQPHSGSTPAGGFVLIANLHVGQARERLERVELELELVKVTEWEMLEFQVGMGESDFLKCGPFELKARGERRELSIDAWSYPEFRKEHEAYRRRIPLGFLTHRFAATSLKVVDAAGHIPSGQGATASIGGPNWDGGVITTTYRSWHSETSQPIDGAISYPVLLKMKLPKRYETEKVRFHFDTIDLPAAK